MLFVLFLCSNLLYIGFSEGSDVTFTCHGDTEEKILYLMSLHEWHFEYKQNEALNKKFIEKCGHFHEIRTDSRGNSMLDETLELIDEGTNVINLWTPDFYNHTLIDEERDKFEYVGVAWSKEPAKAGQEYVRVAKLVSKSVAAMNSGDLLNFIASLGYNDKNEIISQRSCESWATNTAELETVLICIKNSSERRPCFGNNIPHSKSLYIKVVSTTECNNTLEIHRNKLLAVLAPSHFDINVYDKVIVPTIFYETPYMSSEYETYFPNSMNLISGLLVKHAFIKVINDAGWRRVAIISDNAAYSIEFEREMLDFFHDQKMMYNVQRCETHNDFAKAVGYLTSVDTRIVIANVDEEHAKKLVQVMPRNSKFTLLFRVRPFWEQRENWISITMSAKVNEYSDCGGTIKTPACSGVIQGLNIIAKARGALSDSEELHRSKFYRTFANTMKNILTQSNPESIALVERTQDQLIMEIHITRQGEITMPNTHGHLFTEPVPDQQGCYAKVNNFIKPCDYSIYMYIMLVVMMFAVTLLLITCYFHETSPLLSRYQHL